MGIVTGWEFILLIVLAIIILGPQRLPEYAAKLARLVVQVRRMANDAKGQLKDQMGPDFDDLDWRQYDPRQYDPRRIVRQALLEPLDAEPTRPSGSTAVDVDDDLPDGYDDETHPGSDDEGQQGGSGRVARHAAPVSGATPWDPDAT